MEVDQVDSREQQVLKADIHQQQQHRLILHHLFHLTRHQVVDTIIHLKQKTIFQLDHLEQLAILHNVHQLVQAFLALKARLARDNLIQELKLQLGVLLIQVLKLDLQAHLTQLLDNHNHKDLQALMLLKDLRQLDLNLDSEQFNKDLLLVVSEQVVKEVEAVALHHQANRMIAKKEIIQRFLENQTLIIQSCPKFHQHLLTAINKNSQDIMLTLRLVVRCFTFAL